MKELRGFFHKMPIGHISGYFTKEPQVFTSKIPTGHPGGHFANEIREFAHKIPAGYFAGYFVKVIGGFICNVPTGHIGGHIVNEIRGFIHKIPTGYLVGHIVNEIREFVHNVPTGYWGGYFSKEPTICLVGIYRVNCFKTHNKLTMCPLGKCPFAPSVGNGAAPLLQIDLRTHIRGLDGSWFCQSPNRGIFELDQCPDPLKIPSGFRH